MPKSERFKARLEVIYLRLPLVDYNILWIIQSIIDSESHCISDHGYIELARALRKLINLNILTLIIM